jgi:hypothetical protein
MKKEGFHNLAYSLTLDPEQEILGAIEAVSAEAPAGRLEKILGDDPVKGIEAAVDEAPVIYSGNEASYRSDAVELPENYKDSGYRSPKDDDDEAEVVYASPDFAVEEEAKNYVKEIDTQIFANTLGFNLERDYKSSEEKEQAEFYKMSLGFGVRFLMYTLRALTF